jgi:hypothetical protein
MRVCVIERNWGFAGPRIFLSPFAIKETENRKATSEIFPKFQIATVSLSFSLPGLNS